MPDDRRKTDSSDGSSREHNVASKGESSIYRTNYSSKETFAKNQEALSSLESQKMCDISKVEVVVQDSSSVLKEK